MHWGDHTLQTLSLFGYRVIADIISKMGQTGMGWAPNQMWLMSLLKAEQCGSFLVVQRDWALPLLWCWLNSWPRHGQKEKKKRWNCGHRHTQGDHHVKMNAEILKNILSDINCSCPQLGLGSEQTLLYHHRSVCEQQKTESVYNQAGRKERFQA